MRDYGKVHTSFWASTTLRDLDADAKLLALYLLTSPHTHMAGAFRLPPAYACDDLNWTPERLRNGFKTLSDAGWLRRCERTYWVQIVNFAKFNPPDNPNQQKAVDKQIALIPENCSFREGGTEPFPNGSRNPPIPTPVPTKKKKGKAAEVTLPVWIAALEGADAVPADDPLFDWAQTTGIPRDWIALAWWAFEARYESDAKTYTDWRAVFRRAVREDWLRLWRVNRDGTYSLTTAGENVRREMEAA